MHELLMYGYTNPQKEKENYQDAIVDDLALMDVKPDVVTYTSNYFDHLYETCLTLIRGGHTYARLDGLPY
ncbi:hypothetical protein F5Y09DRAFT_138465 [Xylaria sp. FL1042]|nr:hypothetical protein F5Y09DRAFT_138465 [Xylaria sp. FL1042]